MAAMLSASSERRMVFPRFLGPGRGLCGADYRRKGRKVENRRRRPHFLRAKMPSRFRSPSMLAPDTRTRIESLLGQNRIVLFMKGTRHAPRCGFSAGTANLLNELLDD